MQASSERGEALLSVRDLVVEYSSDEQRIHAVNGVSFDLKRGKTLGLVGESGAGKTTIAKSIIGILPRLSAHVRSGQIILNGKDLRGLTEAQMREIRGQTVSMIFQDPMTALDPVRRVGEQIAEVIRIHNDIDRGGALRQASDMLKLVGIPVERAAEYPHQFSGGMKQRVVIAIALACKPELLLADEPTTALDVTIQAQVLRMIANLKRELNTSMILITHDLGVVAQTCDDVAVVYAGEIVESGTKEDIFDHPAHPYTQGLFDALPNLRADVRRLKPIGGLPPDSTNLPEGCKFRPRCRYQGECAGNGDVGMALISEGHYCRCGNPRKRVREHRTDTAGRGP